MRSPLRQLFVLLSLVPSPLLAQRSTSPLPRWGVIAGIGVGRGSGEVNCGTCHDGSGPSMHARVGGALREDLLIVAELDAFSTSTPSSVIDATSKLLALNFVAHWYPRAGGGFFVSAGLGGGRLEADYASPLESDVTSPVGPAFRIGTGYDISLTKALALSAFTSLVHVNGGASRGGTPRMSGNVFIVGVEANLNTRQLIY